jgi:two-component system cell cycle response regulator
MKELSALLKIATALASTQTPQGVLRLLVKEIAQVVRVARCSVILANGSSLIGRVVATYEDPGIEEITIDLQKYPEIAESVATGEVVLVRNIRRDPRMALVMPSLKHLKLYAILVIPITYHEQILGTLFLRTSSVKAFAPRDLLFCKTAARMAANALLGLSRLQLVVRENEHLADQAGRDSLTRLYNQGSLARRLNEESAIAERYGRSVSYLMLDLDNFKEVNDRFGHRQGDDVLKRVARIIVRAIRKSDVAARYGGDEFGIILPETDEAGAMVQADRILEAIRSLHIPTPNNPITISASIGIATMPGDAVSTSDDLIRRADEALYEAKRLGKNRAVRLQPTPAADAARSDSGSSNAA